MSWKIEGLKKFDSIFGRLACSSAKLLVSPRVQRASETHRILVIRPGGIGDAVLLFPALKHLRNFYPNSEITILAEKRNAGIFSLNPDIDSVFLYDNRPFSALSKAISGKYDIVIDTEQWHRLTAFISYLTRACLRAGFDTNERSRMFTHKVSYSQSDYEAVSFLNLVSAVTGEQYEFHPDKPFVEVSSPKSEDIDLALLNLRKNKNMLIGVFAGATVNERKWGAQNFGELSKNLVNNGHGLVLLGGRVDVDSSDKIKNIAGEENLLDFTGKTSLADTAYILSELDLLVSGDSGLMHIAYGVGTPTVSLFGAGIEEKWAPKGKSNLAINKDLQCSPCTKFGYTPQCPYGVKCLADISYSEVLSQIEAVLGNR